tara:strand:+ start:325 stop:768 length:444 start_codon:yes stop_codon:yes gene_type:complete
MENHNIDKISKALLSAQIEISGAEKNATNSFYQNHKYADLESVTNACKSILNKHKISFFQGFDYVVESDVFFVITTLLHESGQSISNRIGFPVVKKDAHGIGSLCTYGRRYGLSAIIGLTMLDDDDDGNKAVNPPNPKLTEDEGELF